MNHKSVVVALALFCVLRLAAQAQLTGLPIARDATQGFYNDISFSGGLVVGENINLYGGRFSYHMYDQLMLFGDVGLVDPDGGDVGYGLQGGVQYAMPAAPGMLIDWALRGTVGYANLDQRFGRNKVNVDYYSMTVGGVASYWIDEMFSVYGFLGLAHNRLSGSRGVSDNETDPALGVGGVVTLTPHFSLYGEVMHIDDLWFGLGVRADLW